MGLEDLKYSAQVIWTTFIVPFWTLTAPVPIHFHCNGKEQCEPSLKHNLLCSAEESQS